MVVSLITVMGRPDVNRFDRYGVEAATGRHLRFDPLQLLIR